MKILIIGEFSSFAKNLALGIKSNGHDAVVFSYGDGWKEIKQDTGSISYSLKNIKLFGREIKGSWRIKGPYYYLKLKKDKKKIENYFDIVLIINYAFLRLNFEFFFPYFSFNDIHQVLKKDGKIFLSSCGRDLPVIRQYEQLRYAPNFKNSRATRMYSRRRLLKIYNQVVTNVKGVIPISYLYAEAYRNNNKNEKVRVCKTLPLPIFLDKRLKYCNNINDKIIIFHGLLKESKGTLIINEALSIIKDKYPSEVEIIVDGKMPFDQYISILSRVNILVDQCTGYGYGMNAILAMAMGKVVLSGNEPELGIEYDRNNIPVINILPDKEDIIRKLERFINNKNDITKVGIESREFVEAFHDATLVAARYIDIFKSSNCPNEPNE